MLEINNIAVVFKGKSIFGKFSLKLSDGEGICLRGASGTGKTTVLKVAAGLLKPSAGSVVNTFRRQAFVFQDDRLLPWLNALDNIRFVLDKSSSGSESQGIALGWLEKFGLADAASKVPGEMSGGMQRRLNIARAMAFNPDLLIMDEAFSFLDAQSIDRCIEEICAWKVERRGTILAVSHEPAYLEPLGCRVLDFTPQ